MKQNSNEEEWLVIINPNAGHGKGAKDWKHISELLSKADIPVYVKFTEKKWDAALLTIKGIQNGYRKIISVGGDGTLNEVVNGVFSNDSCPTKDISIALIPVGTGNDWGRMFEIPTDYEKVIKVIKANNQMLHDIGVVSYYEGKVKKERFFINNAGLGFESVVVGKSNIQKDKGRGGKAIYLYNLVTSLIHYKNSHAEILIEGKTYNASVYTINVGNGRYCGGGMRLTPEALPTDGILNVTVINGMSKLEVIRNLMKLYNGTILDHPKVDSFKCKNFMVSSDNMIYVQADGETLGHTPAEFRIIEGGVNIIYGSSIIR